VAIIVDPAVVEAIEATLMLNVYQARRRARRQLRGLDPVPPPRPLALRLLRAERSRRAVRRPSSED